MSGRWSPVKSANTAVKLSAWYGAEADRVRDVLEAVVAEVAVQPVRTRERALDHVPAGVAGQLAGPVAEPDAWPPAAVVVSEGHAADDEAGRIEAGACGHVRERAVAVVAEDLRGTGRAAGPVVRGDDEVRPAAAREVDELGDARVRGHVAEPRGVGHVREQASPIRSPGRCGTACSDGPPGPAGARRDRRRGRSRRRPRRCRGSPASSSLWAPGAGMIGP